jgi:cobalamin biosynthesis Mg chelatase CobN
VTDSLLATIVLSQGVCWLNTSLTFTSEDQVDLKRHLAWWKPVVEKIIEVILEAKSKETEKEKKARQRVRYLTCSYLPFSVAHFHIFRRFHTVQSFESVNMHLEELEAKPINWLPTRSGSAPSAKRSAESDAPKAAASPTKAKAAPKAKAASKASVKAAASDEEKPAASSSSGRPKRAGSKITYQDNSSDGADSDDDDEEEKKTRKPPAKRAKRD